MGVRARWDQGLAESGSGSSAATAPCSTSASSRSRRMLRRGMDIKVLVLDTQVYSNTGGQASTGSFTGAGRQDEPRRQRDPGKSERRKEIGQHLP